MSWLARICTMVALLIDPAGPGEMTLEVTFGWRKHPVAVPSPTVTTSTGQSVSITRVSALLSEVALVRADGSSVLLAGQFGYIDAASNRHAVTLRDVPEGDYVGLQFRVGVPPQTNHTDPGEWPPGHALNPLTNALHWGWQGG